MSELRTEEEQLDAIKSWWKENGKSLVITIVVVVTAVYGYRAWQQQQVDSSETASAMYQQLISVVESAPNADAEKNLATSKHLTSTIKAEFSDSQYAKYAALLMAKSAVNAGDFPAALEELDWLLAASPKALLKSLATIRKAQILAEQKKLEAALDLLKEVSDSSLQIQVDELKGDIYLAQGDEKKARAAYQKALGNQSTAQVKSIISLKLNDLTKEES